MQWWGALRADGYGRYFNGRVDLKAHRHVYEECVGAIPVGHLLHHECGNRACVNPAHLRPVTRSEHAKLHDTLAAVRHFAHEGFRAKTHCKHGHEFTPENTRLYQGHRYCRACGAERTRLYLLRKAKRASDA